MTEQRAASRPARRSSSESLQPSRTARHESISAHHDSDRAGGRAEPRSGVAAMAASSVSSDRQPAPIRPGVDAESRRLSAADAVPGSGFGAGVGAGPGAGLATAHRRAAPPPDADLAAQLRDRLGRGAAHWIDEARLAIVDDELELRVGNTFVTDLINRHHRHAMDDLAESAVGRRGAWRMVVDAALRPATNAGARDAHRPALAPRRRAPMGVPVQRSLDDFVVGASNRTAHAAAVKLAESDDPSVLRTLFLHGDCGVGKTHLMLGLCAHRQRLWPDERIRYTTGEQFTNEFLHHLRHGTLDQFRSRVRRVDLLAIDDVHFLAGKSRTSGELLHTLDAIGLEGKRVVIASDGHPEQIRTFSHALRSRLAAGLVVRIDLPDRALREKLVLRLATRRGLPISETGVASLVNRCPGSARELEGALNMLAALHSLDGSGDPVGHLLVERMFEQGDGTLSTPVRPAKILDAVCERLGVSRSDPLGTGRNPRVVLARAIFTRLCRELTSMSFPEIARALQRRTHSTVHAAEQRMERLVGANAVVTELGDEEPITMLDLLDQIRRSIRRAA